jgi:predicted unusual protein kinase regulating ubiquinone biosynthesis (AarF/ABC1/UbiB family)
MLTRFPAYRIFLIVTMSIKFFLQIYWFTKRYPEPRDAAALEEWERLLVKQAREYRRVALKLEGLLIKVGQFLSTRADLLPDAFLHELDNLVDQVPPVPWEQVEHVLAKEWRVPYGEILHKISVEAVASASIGVVYRGVLHDGTEVAVKVRRPGIDRIIRADFRATRIVIFLAKRFRKVRQVADWSALYREMVVVLRDELNFLKEMENGEYFAKKYADNPRVKVPRYFSEYTTRSVLVMEWMDGNKVSDLAYLEKHHISREELAARLFHAFAEQIFYGGKFHADPHPGNILVQPDGSIVFLDFGMISSLRSDDAKNIRNLIEGIMFSDMNKILDSLQALHFLLPHADREALSRAIRDLMDLYQKQSIGKYDETVVEEILIDIQSVIKRQPIQLPTEFAFLGRALSTFVGVLHIVSPGVDIVALGKPLVKGWIDEQTSSTDGTPWWRLALTYGAPLLRYPKLIEDALEVPVKRLAFEEMQHEETVHGIYLSRNRLYCVMFFLVSVVLFMVSLWLHNALAEYISAGLAFVAFILVAFTHLQHRRFLRTLSDRRRLRYGRNGL